MRPFKSIAAIALLCACSATYAQRCVFRYEAVAVCASAMNAVVAYNGLGNSRTPADDAPLASLGCNGVPIDKMSNQITRYRGEAVATQSASLISIGHDRPVWVADEYLEGYCPISPMPPPKPFSE